MMAGGVGSSAKNSPLQLLVAGEGYLTADNPCKSRFRGMTARGRLYVGQKQDLKSIGSAGWSWTQLRITGRSEVQILPPQPDNTQNRMILGVFLTFLQKAPVGIASARENGCG